MCLHVCELGLVSYECWLSIKIASAMLNGFLSNVSIRQNIDDGDNNSGDNIYTDTLTSSHSLRSSCFVNDKIHIGVDREGYVD